MILYEPLPVRVESWIRSQFKIVSFADNFFLKIDKKG